MRGIEEMSIWAMAAILARRGGPAWLEETLEILLDLDEGRAVFMVQRRL